MINVIEEGKNPKEFEIIAEQIGISKLYSLEDTSISEGNEEKINIIKLNKPGKDKQNRISNDTAKLREQLDKQIIDYFFDTSKDYLRFNQVLCKLMKTNDVTYLINFNEFKKAANSGESDSSRDDNTKYLRAVMRNIQLCRKFKVKTEFINFCNEPFDLRKGDFDLF